MADLRVVGTSNCPEVDGSSGYKPLGPPHPPVAFTDDKIKQMATQPNLDAGWEEVIANVVYETDLKKDWDTASVTAVEAPQSGRDRDSLKTSTTGANTARRYLLAWLWLNKGIECHTTHVPAICYGYLRLENVLFPFDQSHKKAIVLWYEYLLGMKPRSLPIHSRLFLIPCSSIIRALCVGSTLIIVPSAKELRSMTIYLEQVGTYREDEKEGKQETNAEILGNGDDEDLWHRLRAGRLPGLEDFCDGTIHEFYLVRHHDLHHSVLSSLPKTSLFASHISPFAAALNALQTLKKWELQEIPTQSIYDPTPPPKSTLQDCLRASQVPDDEAITEAFGEFYTQVQRLELAFIADRTWGSPHSNSGFGFGDMNFRSTP